jgi:hypothetical protein
MFAADSTRYDSLRPEHRKLRRRKLAEFSPHGAALEERRVASESQWWRVDRFAKVAKEALDALRGDDERAKLHARTATLTRFDVRREGTF